MTDKTVTYADLGVLRDIDAAVRGHDVDASAVAALLDRLIAAAEADRPPLPEGWYLWDAGGARSVVYVTGEHMSRWDDGDGYFGKADRDLLTPLRPTVTEADVEKAAQVLYGVEVLDGGWPEWASEDAKSAYRNVARAAFGAAGIEVHDA